MLSRYEGQIPRYYERSRGQHPGGEAWPLQPRPRKSDNDRHTAKTDLLSMNHCRRSTVSCPPEQAASDAGPRGGYKRGRDDHLLPDTSTPQLSQPLDPTMLHRNGMRGDQRQPVLDASCERNMHSTAPSLHDRRREEFLDRSYDERIGKRKRPFDEEQPRRLDLRREQFDPRHATSRGLPQEFGFRDCDLPVRQVNW
jgi:hypothetical protein